MLTKAFKTNDTTKIAEIILKKGDLNLTTAQRRKMMDEKRKQIIEYIAKTYVDPRSHLPHPPLRIEQAMTDARVSIDPQKSADDQIKDIVDGLRGIIPLKSENIDLIITVPAQYAAQSYSVLKSSGTLKKEEWLSNGSLKAILEIAAARINVSHYSSLVYEHRVQVAFARLYHMHAIASFIISCRHRVRGGTQ